MSKNLSSKLKSKRKENPPPMGSSQKPMKTGMEDFATFRKHQKGIYDPPPPKKDEYLDENDTSVIDEVLTKEISTEDDPGLKAKAEELTQNISEDNVKEFKDINQLFELTKCSLNSFFDYQLGFYHKMVEAVNLNNELREKYIKCNEKYRITEKKTKGLKDLEYDFDVRTNIENHLNKDKSEQKRIINYSF